MLYPLANRELFYQLDDDTPRVPDHLDDLSSPQARRMQRLVELTQQQREVSK